MSLRDTNVLDIVTKSPDRENGYDLLIVEAPSDAKDESERYGLLLRKLATYVAYVMSDDFSRDCPNTQISNVTIRVFCAKPPNSQMVDIQNVGPKGDRVNRIKVVYQSLDEYLDKSPK